MGGSGGHDMFLHVFSFDDGVAATDCALHSLFWTLTQMKSHMTSVKTEKFKAKVESAYTLGRQTSKTQMVVPVAFIFLRLLNFETI